MNVLKVEEIHKSFKADISRKRSEILHGLSLSADRGEILGFLGPNGAGKTTTIKIILGLMKPDSGRISIFGMDAGDKRAMSRVGYLPENPFFYPHLSLGEFLRFCARMSGLRSGDIAAKVSETSSLVGLGVHLDMSLRKFSKGMLQRCGLAQAILHDPDLLILDEPFSGLDPLGRKMVRDILIELKRKGKTIFFSSHILPDMEALCNRAAIIRDGKIVKSIGLDEIFLINEGKVEVTARMTDSFYVTDLDDYIERADSNGKEIFLTVKKQEYLRTVLQHIYNNGGEILRVANQSVSLEDVFLGELSRRPAGDRTGVREREESKEVRS